MRDSVASLVGTAGQVGHHGDARGPPLDPIQGGAQPLGGGRHQRRVKGRAHVQGDDASNAQAARPLARRLDPLRRPAQDDLAGAVVIGDPGPLLGRAGQLRHPQVSPDEGDHATGAPISRLLCRRGPLGHEADARLQR